MPKGPQGQKRPADVIGNAVEVTRAAKSSENKKKRAEIAKRVAKVR